MRKMKYGYLVAPKTKNNKSEDIIEIFTVNDIKFFILCDGAGDYGNGFQAADNSVTFIKKYIIKNSPSKHDVDAVINSSMMVACDNISGIGQSTCIVIALYNDRVICSSVGDSKAYLFGSKQIEMTANQMKARLGNASFSCCSYYQFIEGQQIVIGSYGLWNFVKMEKIKHLAKYRDLDDALKLAYENAIKFEQLNDFSMILIRN